jgi:pyruvate kinase
MRLTKIICTLGPASSSREQICALHDGGMNIARLNFSHGSQEGHSKTSRLIRQINKEEGRNIGVMLDTKGPEIRTGDVKEPIVVGKGTEVVFSPRPMPGEKRPVILVNYDSFAKDVLKTDRIIVDNGELLFEIVSVGEDGTVVGRAGEEGKIGSRRHVNLPGADIDMPSITEQDWSDLALGAAEGMDSTALSFIRTAKEVEDVKTFLRGKGSPMLVISKIETKKAVDNIEAIIEASDGIMVARGDLGAELPFELIPAIQDRIVELCRKAGKPVIVATHMLESMIHNPMPTRAEVTDVAHAAITRADVTMLSGETAAGKHPLRAVEAMARILRETETHLEPTFPREVLDEAPERQARAEGAVTMASALRAPAIAVLTRTGNTARAISKYRPLCPVFAFSDDPTVVRALQLHYGIQPHAGELHEDREKSVEEALKIVKQAAGLKTGTRIVVVSDTITKDGPISTVHVRAMP